MTRTPYQDDEEDYSLPYMVLRLIVTILLLWLLVWSIFKCYRSGDSIDPTGRGSHAGYCRHEA